MFMVSCWGPSSTLSASVLLTSSTTVINTTSGVGLIVVPSEVVCGCGEVVVLSVGKDTGSILREALEGFGAFAFTLISFSESLSS